MHYHLSIYATYLFYTKSIYSSERYKNTFKLFFIYQYKILKIFEYRTRKRSLPCISKDLFLYYLYYSSSEIASKASSNSSDISISSEIDISSASFTSVSSFTER